jgi:DNA-3-methyladenine glycosylase I
MEKQRCPWAWCRKPGLYRDYHDREWGTPLHDERRHYEFLLMECLSCGLSFELMLRKRDIFRQCFADFDFERVATFTADDVDRIMQTEGMIRSRRKIEAMVSNAQCFIGIRKEFGSFDRYIWHFTDGKTLIYPDHQREMPVSNPLSDTVAKDLKKHGFKYVGTVIIYSHLQAIGIINDHQEGCFRYKELLHTSTILENGTF